MWEPSGLFKSLVKNQGIAKLAAQLHDKKVIWSYIASKWKHPNLTLMWVSSPLGVYWCGLNESGETFKRKHICSNTIKKLSKQQEVSCVLHGWLDFQQPKQTTPMYLPQEPEEAVRCCGHDMALPGLFSWEFTLLHLLYFTLQICLFIYF